jgi:tRNA(fMet)-specific endonuclease VapC
VRYLLDTNVVSDLVRRPQGLVARAISRVGEARVCTSLVVAAELRYGAQKRASPALTAQLEAILAVLEVEPLEAPVDEHYGRIRTALERSGTPIGGNDLLIAAHALALECTLVTANDAEFGRVPGLRCANWLRY